jgi:hypothetical protein
MEYVEGRPRFDDPEAAARRLVQISHVEQDQGGRIQVEKVKRIFLFQDNGSATEWLAGIERAIKRGWLSIDENGVYVKITPEDAGLFA